MATSVRLIHRQSGLEKTGYAGFSWTSFFFSGIPAMTRGDVGIGLGVLLGTILLGAFSLGLLGVIVNLVWACVYNKMYTTKLLEAGYEIAEDSVSARQTAEKLGIGASSANAIGRTSSPAAETDYDLKKWNALLKYDPDIKRIADQLSPYGQKYIDQFASAYMALNDKNYLPQIIQTIIATAKEDAARVVTESGVTNNFSWSRYSDGSLEARIDRQWMRISSVEQLKSLPLSRSV